MPHASHAPRFIDRPFLAEYRTLRTPALVERFKGSVHLIDRRVLELSNEQLDTYFRPEVEVGRWSVRALLGHLADADLAELHRMRRTVAEDKPVISPWDENAFLDSGLYGDSKTGGSEKPVAGFVAVIHTLRLWGAEWLSTLSEESLHRTALHPEKGELSVHDMLVNSVWHFEHHIKFLDLKLTKLIGPRPAAQ